MAAALTIDKLKQYFLPKNASRANNYSAAINQLAVYNDSIPLYSAIKLVIDTEVTTLTGTDLSNTPASTTILISSSTGADTTLPAATTSLAGLMSSTDKTRLNNLITLSGVAAASTNLGSFTGSIILDNRTIKQALQDLETSLEAGTGLPLGDLTSNSPAITVNSGTSSVFVPTGVSLDFNPGSLDLADIGGELNLSQINAGGASSGAFLVFDGSEWGPNSTPSYEHNNLDSLQGGTTDQYYHLTSALYNVLSNSSSSRIIGRSTAGSGAVQALTIPNSVTISSGAVQLVNDASAPGNSKYYGTNGSGTKGWFSLPSTSGTLTTASDSADLDFTISGTDLTAVLTETGVTADSYGTAADTLVLDVDNKGRIISLVSTPISIPNTQISNWTTAIQNGNYTIAGNWTFSNNVTNSSVPTLNSHLVNKAYVDSLFATGVNSIAVDIATTTSGTLATSFEDGDTIDGIVIATGDYILIKDQVSLDENGIYIVQASGAPTRAPEMDAAAEVDGTVVVVKNGSANAGTLWITASDVVTLETDPIEFVNINTPFSPSLGTSNQIFGMDNAGAASEWKTLTGTANQVTVTHGVGTVTLATPQDIATTSSPTFRDLTLSDTTSNLNQTSTAGAAAYNLTSNTSAATATITGTGGTAALSSSNGTGPTLLLTDITAPDVFYTTGVPRIDFRNTHATAHSSGRQIGALLFSGSISGSQSTGGAISAAADGTFTGSSTPTYISIHTAPSGSTTPSERVRINSSGETQFLAGAGIRLYDSDNSNYIALVPPATGDLSSNYTLTLPTSDGTASQVLTTDGSGVLSWGNVATDTLYTADGTIGAGRVATLAGSIEFDGSGVLDGDYFLINLNPGTGQSQLNMTSGAAGSTQLQFETNLATLNSGGFEVDVQGGGDIRFFVDGHANKDIYWRNNDGVLGGIPIGSEGDVLTVVSGDPAWAAPATPAVVPAGTNYNLQYYNSGAFGADSNITVTPGAQMKLAVGTNTPAATLHAKNHNSAGSSTLLVEDSAGNNIHNTLSSGYMQWGNNETLPRIFQSTLVGTQSYTGGGLTIQGFFEVGASYEVLGLTHTEVTDGSDGPFSVLKLTGSHAPTSGAGDYVSIKVAPTINQTGTHTGDGYGIQVAPTLTAIGDTYVAYLAAVDDASAYGFVQEGDASINYFDGDTGIGTTTPTAKLDVTGTTRSTHFRGKTSTPSYTLGANTVIGSGASLTLVGTDAGFEATLTTGSPISAVGTLFTVTFDTAYTTNAPVVVFSERDLNSATAAPTIKCYVNSTSTTNFTFNNITALTASTTYKWSFIIMGK